MKHLFTRSGPAASAGDVDAVGTHEACGLPQLGEDRFDEFLVLVSSVWLAAIANDDGVQLVLLRGT